MGEKKTPVTAILQILQEDEKTSPFFNQSSYRLETQICWSQTIFLLNNSIVFKQYWPEAEILDLQAFIFNFAFKLNSCICSYRNLPLKSWDFFKKSLYLPHTGLLKSKFLQKICKICHLHVYELFEKYNLSLIFHLIFLFWTHFYIIKGIEDFGNRLLL